MWFELFELKRGKLWSYIRKSRQNDHILSPLFRLNYFVIMEAVIVFSLLFVN